MSNLPTPSHSPSTSHAAAPLGAALYVLPLLFAASGCAALIYQVAWFQLLTLHLGASAISLGVLLATFLGGLCLGSLLLPRAVPAHVHPLKVYAAIELAIGALAVAVLYVIPTLGGFYASSATAGASSIALRAVVAALCLLPPAVLIGATFPAVARWVAAAPAGTARLGFLYAANTAGAVLGAVAAGFWLLRLYDVHAATFAATALNVIVGLTSLALARRARSSEAAAVRVPAGRPVGRRWPVYAATALSGFTALTAEVLWTRHLALLFGSTVYTFALILAMFLFGLGAGAAAGAALGRRVDSRAALAACQLLICAAMAWAAHVIARVLPFLPIDVTLPTTAAIGLQLDLLRAAWAMLPATLLWGASFPLAIAAAEPRDDARRVIGRLYAANTAGAIAGALLTTFVLVTAIGTQATQRLAIVAAACAAALLGVALRAHFRRTRLLIGAAAAVAVAVLVVTVPSVPPQLVAYGRFLPTRGMDANVVYVGEGLTASIAVTREPDGTLTYHNAGKTQASSYPQDVRLQRMLGHLTTLAADAPRSVLVVGLGAGITAGAVSIDPAVERVVVAEIEPLVPVAAGEHFAEHNFGVVTNPKVTLAIDDGRHYLATTDEKFDAITSDPLDPWVKGAAALYTREFWELCKARLNEGGVITAFLQLYESTDLAVRSEIATFFEVFPNGAVFANTVNGLGYDAVLLARAGDAPIDAGEMQRRYASSTYAPVARSLREIGFDSALELLATYAGQKQDLAAWLADAPLNTDRSLRLQYLAGLGLNEINAEAIFAAMMRHPPRFPHELLTGSPAQLEALRQLMRGRHDSY